MPLKEMPECNTVGHRKRIVRKVRFETTRLVTEVVSLVLNLIISFYWNLINVLYQVHIMCPIAHLLMDLTQTIH